MTDRELEYEYIERHSTPEPRILHKLVRETNLRMVHGRMCSGHIQGRLLKMLVQMISPRKVLELGTFTGYSALCIAEGLATGIHSDAKLISIEANDEYETFIRENLASSPYGHFVELIIGDAVGTMKRFDDTDFDLIFIDADKRSYVDYYVEAKRLLRPGGYIFADNTLWDGHVYDENSHDSQTRGIREFNELVASDAEVEVVILPIRDGLSLIRKRNPRLER